MNKIVASVNYRSIKRRTINFNDIHECIEHKHYLVIKITFSFIWMK